MKLSNLLLVVVIFTVATMSIGCAAIGQKIDDMIEFPALKHLVGTPTHQEVLVTNNTNFIAEVYCFEEIVAVLWPGETFKGSMEWGNPNQEIPMTVAFYTSIENYRSSKRVGFAAKDFQHQEGSQNSTSWEIHTEDIIGSDGRKLVAGTFPAIINGPRPEELPKLKTGSVAVIRWPDYLFEDRGIKLVRIINPTNFDVEIFYNGRQEKLLKAQTMWLLKIEHYYKKPKGHTIIAKVLDGSGNRILDSRSGMQTFKTTSRNKKISSDLFWIKPPTK
jgi:hypothetical protein